jgi:hypothetical protein
MSFNRMSPAIYARLGLGSVRESVEQATSAMLMAGALVTVLTPEPGDIV